MSTNYLHGSLGSASVNGTTVCLTGWDMTIASDMAETTTTCSNGWREYIPGLKGATGTISGRWDLNANPMGTGGGAYNIYPGAYISPLKLNLTSSSFYSFNAYVSDFKATLSVDNVVEWEASFQSTGQVTYPV